MSSADRILKILSLFSVERPEWTVEQAAQALNTSISTTYRYFATLTRAGLIASGRGGRYILGPAVLQLDWIMRETDPLLAAARPAMKILGGASVRPSVVLLCRLYRGQVMCVAEESAGGPPFASSYQRGRPRPLFRGAASKIILANLPDRTVKAMLAKSADEMASAGLGADWPTVRASLRALRDQGYSITAGEIDTGLIGIAAPIMSPDGSPVGSLSFVLTHEHVSDESAVALSRLLISAAKQIGDTYRA